ncbi:MBL fold metallo-hydrolase [Pseudorhodoferax sp.]|uniref:MBL fold metallo-hydrolase n=1 Tax=Pseudorhodoferax sp. TaxID=1993553 RepID=UPI002DD68541|nr:MBL fold metallo-hydrolase [Pseudorhodoferax sp.]
MSTAWLQDLGGGVYAVDTAFQREHFDAAYLLRRDGRAAFIDTGTNFGVPRLLQALQVLGIPRDAVDWVIPTHVHLDHAGGVGLLMQELPTATLLVHPRGVRHLVDPGALYQGALAVYGAEEMARSYGELRPVPAGRVQASSDEQVVLLGGSPLRLIDTPGHARHHHCIWDEHTRGWFTGDTFGLSYREFDTERGAWIMPTSTPVQFEPEVLRLSVQRLLQADPQCMYLTHFSRVTGVPRLAALLLGLLDETVALGRACAALPAAQRHQQLKQGLLALYRASLADHGCHLDTATLARLLELDIELNAQGIAIWLDRESRPRA